MPYRVTNIHKVEKVYPTFNQMLAPGKSLIFDTLPIAVPALKRAGLVSVEPITEEVAQVAPAEVAPHVHRFATEADEQSVSAGTQDKVVVRDIKIQGKDDLLTHDLLAAGPDPIEAEKLDKALPDLSVATPPYPGQDSPVSLESPKRRRAISTGPVQG